MVASKTGHESILRQHEYDRVLLLSIIAMLSVAILLRIVASLVKTILSKRRPRECGAKVTRAEKIIVPKEVTIRKSNDLEKHKYSYGIHNEKRESETTMSWTMPPQHWRQEESSNFEQSNALHPNKKGSLVAHETAELFTQTKQKNILLYQPIWPRISASPAKITSGVCHWDDILDSGTPTTTSNSLIDQLVKPLTSKIKETYIPPYYVDTTQSEGNTLSASIVRKIDFPTKEGITDVQRLQPLALSPVSPEEKLLAKRIEVYRIEREGENATQRSHAIPASGAQRSLATSITSGSQNTESNLESLESRPNIRLEEETQSASDSEDLISIKTTASLSEQSLNQGIPESTVVFANPHTSN